VGAGEPLLPAVVDVDDPELQAAATRPKAPTAASANHR